MARSARKRQEILLREEELLGIARKILLERGVSGLTMERVAEATPYSKGTIYQHFGSKDDILAALVRQSILRRISLFERAALFRGTSRERMIAIGKANELLYRLHPDYFISENVICGYHVRKRLSTIRQAELHALEQKAFAVILGVIRDGFASGDIRGVPGWLTPEKILFGLWGLSHGLYNLWQTDLPIHAWADDVFLTHHRLTSFLCDGYGWHPLSNELDYDACVQRIWTEVFPQEHEELKKLSLGAGS